MTLGEKVGQRVRERIKKKRKRIREMSKSFQVGKYQACIGKKR